MIEPGNDGGRAVSATARIEVVGRPDHRVWSADERWLAWSEGMTLVVADGSSLAEQAAVPLGRELAGSWPPHSVSELAFGPSVLLVSVDQRVPSPEVAGGSAEGPQLVNRWTSLSLGHWNIGAEVSSPASDGRPEVSPDGRWLAVQSVEVRGERCRHQIRVLSSATFAEAGRWESEFATPDKAAAAPRDVCDGRHFRWASSGNYLFVTGDSGPEPMLAASSGREVVACGHEQLEGSGGPPCAFALSDDERLVAYREGEGDWHVLNIATGEHCTLPGSHGMEGCAFSGDGKRVACATDVEVAVWRLLSGEPMWRAPTLGELREDGMSAETWMVSFGPRHEVLVLGTSSSRLCDACYRGVRYDAESGQLLPLPGSSPLLLTQRSADRALVFLDPAEPAFFVCGGEDGADGQTCEQQRIDLPPLGRGGPGRWRSFVFPFRQAVSRDGELLDSIDPSGEADNQRVLIPTRPGRAPVRIPSAGAFSPSGRLYVGDDWAGAWRTSDGSSLGLRPRVASSDWAPRGWSADRTVLSTARGSIDLARGVVPGSAPRPPWREERDPSWPVRGDWEVRAEETGLGLYFGAGSEQRTRVALIRTEHDGAWPLDVSGDGSEVLFGYGASLQRCAGPAYRWRRDQEERPERDRVVGKACMVFLGTSGAVVRVEGPRTIRAIAERDGHELWNVILRDDELRSASVVSASSDGRVVLLRGVEDLHLLQTDTGRIARVFRHSSAGALTFDGRLAAVKPARGPVEIWAGSPWSLRAWVAQFDAAAPVLLTPDGRFEPLGFEGDEHPGLRCVDGAEVRPLKACSHLRAEGLWQKVLARAHDDGAHGEQP